MAQSSLSHSFTPPINDLPQELLIVILERVRNTTSPLSFVSCLLCCRRWYDLGLPLICDVILLKRSNLETFLTRFPPVNCILITSLTISIKPESPASDSAGRYVEDEEHMKRNGSPETKTLWGQLQNLATMIGKMTNLSFLSFVVTSENPWTVGFWIPRPIIASMIGNLSRSCVGLEIDTRGNDFSELGSVHLCDKIRDVLPHLRHFRVRLSTLCSAMFCASFNANDATEDHSKAPSLKSVIINCVPQSLGYGGSARRCGFLEMHPYYRSFHDIFEARGSLATTLRDLVVRGSYPEIERLWLVDMQYHDNDDPTVYAAYNRRDILLNKTWAIPFRNILGVERNAVLTRTPEVNEVVSFQWVVEELAEAQTWKETLSGCRMPAATIATVYPQREDCWEKPLPMESVEAFQIRHPGKSCRLWVNEKKTGLRLLHAFERQGLVDQTPVRQITPSGWRNDGEELEPES